MRAYTRTARPDNPTLAQPDIGPLLSWAKQSDEADRRFIGLVRNAHTSAAWVRRAVANGANPNAVHGNTSVLMVAARGLNLDKVDGLLDAGADPNLPGYGTTPTALYAWADWGREQGRTTPAYDHGKAQAIAKRLLAHGCNACAGGSYAYPPLFSIGRLETVCLLFDCGVDPSRRVGEGGCAPGLFPLVAKFGSAVLRAAKTRGFRLDVVDTGSGQSLLHHFPDFFDIGMSVGGYRREMRTMVNLLMQSGLDVDQRDRDGRTALVHTIKTHLGQARVRPAIQALLAGGADPSARDRFGNTALHYASEDWSARLLLDAGVDTECRNLYGERPDEALAREACGPVRSFQIREAINAIQARREAMARAVLLGTKPSPAGSVRRRA